MFAWIRDVDRLLRGGYTGGQELSTERIALPVRTLLVSGFLLGAIYGVFMGLFAPLSPGEAGLAQMVATTLKVPLLFLLSLAVTFPSLYVFSACRTRVLERWTRSSCCSPPSRRTSRSWPASDHYRTAIVLKGGVFALATLAGQVTLNKHYAVLVAHNRLHHVGRLVWVTLYVFVAIQSAWLLRPFVGTLGSPVASFARTPGATPTSSLPATSGKLS